MCGILPIISFYYLYARYPHWLPQVCCIEALMSLSSDLSYASFYKPPIGANTLI